MDSKFTLQEVLDQANAGVFKNVSLNDKEIVNLLNMTLLDIHNRLVLNQAIIEIPLEKDKVFYKISDYTKWNILKLN